jgi:hypothetical protein
MRCVMGFVLFVVLCYCGIRTLNAVATARELANSPGLSQRAAEAAAWKVVGEYHAYVYVAAGIITIAACSLPTLLLKQRGFDEEDAWRRAAEQRVAQRSKQSQL